MGAGNIFFQLERARLDSPCNRKASKNHSLIAVITFLVLSYVVL